MNDTHPLVSQADIAELYQSLQASSRYRSIYLFVRYVVQLFKLVKYEPS